MNPPASAESLSGLQIYTRECAPCHGYDGKGAGPVAGAIIPAPPDLTALAMHNGGVFPMARVEAFLRESVTDSKAHGAGEMQVWGPTFRGLDPADPRVSVRIGDVADYLESIQVK